MPCPDNPYSTPDGISKVNVPFWLKSLEINPELYAIESSTNLNGTLKIFGDQNYTAGIKNDDRDVLMVPWLDVIK